jgi:NAD(P)-dependent dehydrogenase (short-subunit alcohol dehydrogenase family)
MSSIAGWRGAAAMGPYSSSKFALEGMLLFLLFLIPCGAHTFILLGAVESLQKEVQNLNIEILLVVLGMFRTNILMPERRKVIRTQAHEDYDAMIDALHARHENTMSRQPGDPQVAVERIVDMVTRQGTMSGVKSLPLRMALGSDALAIIRQECEETLKSLESFQQFSWSTDFSEAEIIQRFE